jgi:hypothetical protein
VFRKTTSFDRKAIYQEKAVQIGRKFELPWTCTEIDRLCFEETPIIHSQIIAALMADVSRKYKNHI